MKTLSHTQTTAHRPKALTGRKYLWLPVLVGATGVCVMSVFILIAVVNGNLSQEGKALLSMPWGLLTLIDIYTGLFLVATWIFWRETTLKHSLPWIVCLLLLGNLGTCLYVIKAAIESNGNLPGFFLGKNTDIRQ